MQFTPLEIPDVWKIEPVRHTDDRGYFVETFRETVFYTEGIAAPFVQDNQSRSRKGVVRGLHYQAPPSAQGKLVRVLRGSILDVAVDIRFGSPWYGKHVALELNGSNGWMVWIPPGFAHGFLAREDDTDVLYKVTAEWNPKAERGIRWNDAALGIDWGAGGTEEVVRISSRDADLPLLADVPREFKY